MTPGIMPNGLFWTMRIPDRSFRVRRNGKSARLRLKKLPLVETFVFNGPLAIASQAEIFVHWRAASDFVERGFGNTVPPDDQGAFKGHFADSMCTGYVSGWETGFAFGTEELSSDTFYASQGYEKNGVFL